MKNNIKWAQNDHETSRVKSTTHILHMYPRGPQNLQFNPAIVRSPVNNNVSFSHFPQC